MKSFYAIYACLKYKIYSIADHQYPASDSRSIGAEPAIYTNRVGLAPELFTLFNLFALLLVLKVAVDYAIFFQMADSDDTTLAVTLAAGIFNAFLLAPLIGCRRP